LVAAGSGRVHADIGILRAVIARAKNRGCLCHRNVLGAGTIAAHGQKACSSTAFETRLVGAMIKGEAQLKSIPPGKIADYARCYARVACAELTKVEFEMYALSQITSDGAEAKVERE
jgi:hypothetical protein